MADLTDIQAAQSVKIVGNNSTGTETNPVGADSNGNLQVIPTSDGPVAPGTAASKSSLMGGQYNATLPTATDGQQVALAVDANGRLLTSGVSEFLSPLPGFVARTNKVIAAGQVVLNTYVMTDDIAIVDFHFGGRGPGQSSLLRINPAAVEFVPGGGFNSSGDVALWTNASIGSSALATWTYDTAQKTEGTGSARLNFTQSDNNNYPAIQYTWSTPKDISAWRYINADVYVTTAAGGNQTRTASIIFTDSNGATRTYQVSGGTVNAPLFPAQNSFYTFNREITSPDSTTGTFDPYNVVSVTLKLQDTGNKTGTIYWDNVRFTQSQELIERIYIDANRTFQLVLNPVELFDVGETLGLRFQNNDTVSREFTVTAKGVTRS